MKAIKTGTITDASVIYTGLKSISFIMIYKKTLTSKGVITTIWHDTLGSNTVGCVTYNSVDDARLYMDIAGSDISVYGGTFEFISSSGYEKPSTGVTYTWVAYGEK